MQQILQTNGELGNQASPMRGIGKILAHQKSLAENQKTPIV